MPEEYLTAAQVAVHLHLQEATVYRLIKRQEIPAIKIGGSYRIPVSDLERRLAVPGAKP